MRLNIGICDDERAESGHIKSIVSAWADKGMHSVRLNIFESAESFLFAYEDDKMFDILLLDIQMKKMDGVELAKHIRKENENVQIIFITGFPDFIGEGYEVSALHYLQKPINKDKLFEVLDKAVIKLSKTEKSIFIAADGENIRLLAKDIIYIEAQDHYIAINALLHSYRIKMNLSDIEKMLGDGFFRCQRSFIINLNYIKKITRTAVIMEKNKEIPLSRNLYDAVNQAVINYFQ